jgi:hypothetical protein
MNETKPKKMVSRNVAIALGIIIIILASGLIIAVKDFYDTTSLSKSTILLPQKTVQFEAPNGSVELGSVSGANSFKIDYSGYIDVDLYPLNYSLPTGYYVRVIYSYKSSWFYNTFDTQINDEVTPNNYIFAVLPTSNLQIIVGNSEQNGTIFANVTITYYY